METFIEADLNCDIPEAELAGCVIELANSVINACKEIKINQDIQATERARIRAQAEVCNALIEADTMKFEKALRELSVERMEFVRAFCTLATGDMLDENTVRICEWILQYLGQNTPVDLLDHNPAIPRIDK